MRSARSCAPVRHTVAMRYLVTGRYGRHKRTFHIDAPDLAVARSEALALAKFYGSGTENYTAQTWRLGAITVELDGIAVSQVIPREKGPYLRLYR